MKAFGFAAALCAGLLLMGGKSSNALGTHARPWRNGRAPAADLKPSGLPSPLIGKRLVAHKEIVIDADMAVFNMVVIQAGAVVHGRAAMANIVDNDLIAPGTSFCALDLVPGQKAGDILFARGQEVKLVEADSSGAMGYVYNLSSSNKVTDLVCIKMSRAAKTEVDDKMIRKELGGIFEVR